jgi:hypothetical protein
LPFVKRPLSAISMARVSFSVTCTLPWTMRRSQAVISPERLIPGPTIRRLPESAVSVLVRSPAPESGAADGEAGMSIWRRGSSGWSPGRDSLGRVGEGCSARPMGRVGSVSFFRNIRGFLVWCWEGGWPCLAPATTQPEDTQHADH